MRNHQLTLHRHGLNGATLSSSFRGTTSQLAFSFMAGYTALAR
jgi:hypothetical protein